MSVPSALSGTAFPRGSFEVMREAARASKLPDYAEELIAFHHAFAGELWSILKGFDLSSGARVLDIPAGDGFYAASFARLLGPDATVVAADHSDAYLDLARTQADCLGVGGIHYCPADAYKLPFDEGSFDLVWCAQSLISLEDPVAALREFRCVLRPGGTLAVLENDNYHQMLLPWDADVEVPVLQALRQESRQLYGHPDRVCPGRHLRTYFEQAGLRDYCKRTRAFDRQAPLSELDRHYLRYNLRSLRELTEGHLPLAVRPRLHAYTDPSSPEYLPARPDFEMALLNTVATGVRP